MLNVMVDLETLGQTPGCSIVSIGAVFFDPLSGDLGREFYQVVDRVSCTAVGLHEDGATLQWWEKQSPEAREAFDRAIKGGAIIHDALSSFNLFITGSSEFLGDHVISSNIRVWGNGADFDNAILACAYRAVRAEVPWKFWNNRCYRTLKNLFPEVKMERSGTHHNALDDAKSQAVHAAAIMKHMRASSTK